MCQVGHVLPDLVSCRFQGPSNGSGAKTQFLLPVEFQTPEIDVVAWFQTNFYRTESRSVQALWQMLVQGRGRSLAISPCPWFLMVLLRDDDDDDDDDDKISSQGNRETDGWN